jgi:hypothetical protein
MEPEGLLLCSQDLAIGLSWASLIQSTHNLFTSYFNLSTITLAFSGDVSI